MAASVYHLGEFRLDCDRFELSRAGRILKLERKPMELLHLLVARNGALVTRAEIAERLWDSEVYVDTEHGINTAIRKIRQVLRDRPEEPQFIETVTGKGYRFIGPIVDLQAGSDTTQEVTPSPSLPERRWKWRYLAALFALLFIAAGALYESQAVRSARTPTVRASALTYTQLTDFTDSAVAPALSPDGRMLAFIRGCCGFFSADPIYIKMLPDGEAIRLTDDNRPKCCLTFSPEGSMVAYTALQPPTFSTYTVPVLGGEPRLFVSNAAGLTWLDDRQLLFSQTRSGVHLGVVTATANRENVRELYFPPHEREMAHYSFASPDRKFALVVQMNEQGLWSPCQLISMTGDFGPRPSGPDGACTSAGWSPDGAWMYFTAYVKGHIHLWRQRFPDGQPEQITSGAAEEDGVVVERDGHSVITSVGAHESALWIHDSSGDRCLSSEGEVVDRLSPPSFSSDAKRIYYLLSRNSSDSGARLWSADVSSGVSHELLPGISMLAFNISRDEKRVVYITGDGRKSSLWIASLDGRSGPRQIGHSGETSPHFGARGKILFRVSEGNRNYLEQMNQDGTGRCKMVPYPIIEIQGVSPGGRWIMAMAPTPSGTGVAPIAIPAGGGTRQIIYASYDVPVWSPNGRFLFVPVDDATQMNPGRSLAIPVGPNEALPRFPAGGIPPGANAAIMAGARSVSRAELIPENDPSQYAFVNTTVHRNLYRISLPE